jgi:hypothetical protein
MLSWIGHLALQRLEAASHDIRFAEAKLSGQLLQPALLSPVEVDLQGVAYALPPVIMSFCHDIMLLTHDTWVKHGASTRLAAGCAP